MSEAILKIRVKTGADANRVRAMSDGRLKVFVKARPEKGKANEEVIRVLAGYLSVPRSHIRILSGLSSPDKRVCVTGGADNR